MPASGSSFATSTTSPRLGIVHFLGWMVGVGIVLAIYRAATEWNELPEEVDLTQRLIQLGFGLAYGTAASGLGLFVWRWTRGTASGPTQPGHWLLVFGGIGLVIDVGLAAALEGYAWLANPRNAYGIGAFETWSKHQ